MWRTTTWRCVVPLHDVASQSRDPLLDVASLSLSAGQRGIARSICSAFDRSTSRSLDDVNCYHFPRCNTLLNISGQLIYFHNVEGRTGCSTADRPWTPIQVNTGTNTGRRTVGFTVSTKCQKRLCLPQCTRWHFRLFSAVCTMSSFFCLVKIVNTRSPLSCVNTETILTPLDRGRFVAVQLHWTWSRDVY